MKNPISITRATACTQPLDTSNPRRCDRSLIASSRRAVAWTRLACGQQTPLAPGTQSPVGPTAGVSAVGRACAPRPPAPGCPISDAAWSPDARGHYGSLSACTPMAGPGRRVCVRPMSTLIAINGFGRIGRGFLRAAVESGADLEIVAVNDVADAGTLAHLLTYDSIYGRFPAPYAPRSGILHVGDLRMPRVHRARPGGSALGRTRGRRRDRVEREVPHARRRRPPHGGRARAR